jgi:hypothetical protein
MVVLAAKELSAQGQISMNEDRDEEMVG